MQHTAKTPWACTTSTNRSTRLTAAKYLSYKPSDRIGQPYIQVDPKKIVGVVETNWPDEARTFAAADPLTDKIGQNVADFLAADMKRGIIPSTFLPLQSGVGKHRQRSARCIGT